MHIGPGTGHQRPSPKGRDLRLKGRPAGTRAAPIGDAPSDARARGAFGARLTRKAREETEPDEAPRWGSFDEDVWRLQPVPHCLRQFPPPVPLESDPEGERKTLEMKETAG